MRGQSAGVMDAQWNTHTEKPPIQLRADTSNPTFLVLPRRVPAELHGMMPIVISDSSYIPEDCKEFDLSLLLGPLLAWEHDNGIQAMQIMRTQTVLDAFIQPSHSSQPTHSTRATTRLSQHHCIQQTTQVHEQMQTILPRFVDATSHHPD